MTLSHLLTNGQIHDDLNCPEYESFYFCVWKNKAKI